MGYAKTDKRIAEFIQGTHSKSSKTIKIRLTSFAKDNQNTVDNA
jgi:hypothetical protein